MSSKIGTTTNLGAFLQDWTLQENTSGGAAINLVGTSQAQLIKAEAGANKVYTAFRMSYTTPHGNPAFVPVAAFTNTGLETEQYYFHPDHLGSSNYITNIAGEVSQHTEYFAFGETFVEEHKGSNNSPYKFNGKELDAESGLYYFGARYYDPRISIWASVDPLAEAQPGKTPYHFCSNNPINRTDPTGMIDDWYMNEDTGNVQWYNGSNERSGHINLGTSTNFVSGTGQGLQLNSNGTATDMNSGAKYGPNTTISIGGSTVKTGTVSEHSPAGMFFGGLGNAVLGVVGVVGSIGYMGETLGLGAAAGGAVALTLSCGEVGIGCAQMADAFSMNPDTVLHNYSTVPGLIAAQNGSQYAPLIDGAAGWASGSLSGGNINGAVEALNGAVEGKKVIQNTATIIDTYSDASSLIQGVTEPKKQ